MLKKFEFAIAVLALIALVMKIALPDSKKIQSVSFLLIFSSFELVLSSSCGVPTICVRYQRAALCAGCCHEAEW